MVAECAHAYDGRDDLARELEAARTRARDGVHVIVTAPADSAARVSPRGSSFGALRGLTHGRWSCRSRDGELPAYDEPSDPDPPPLELEDV
jgi:hypothetical protein